MKSKNLKIEKQILDRLNVKHRLEELYAQHSSNESRLEKTEKSKVLSIFEKLGYKAKYFPGEKFYSISKDLGDIQALINFDIRRGKVELIFTVLFRNDLIFGGPMGWIYSPYILENEFKPILDPRFSSYEELEIILREFLDFSIEVLNLATAMAKY